MIVWKNRMFRGCLVGRPYSRATRETQLSSSALTLSILVMCRAHALFRGMLSCELPAKTLLSSIAWVFIYSLSITQPLQLNPTINTGHKRLNKITIKFGTKLKPTKHIVVNYNFTEYGLGWVFRWVWIVFGLGFSVSFNWFWVRFSSGFVLILSWVFQLLFRWFWVNLWWIVNCSYNLCWCWLGGARLWWCWVWGLGGYFFLPSSYSTALGCCRCWGSCWVVVDVEEEK